MEVGNSAAFLHIGGGGGGPGGQFNIESQQSFQPFLVLQGVPHYYKTSVEKSVEKSLEIQLN